MTTDTQLDDTPMLASAARAFAPPSSMVRGQADAKRYARATLAYVCLLYAALGLALYRVMPAWLLLAVVPLVYLRLALALHELLHAATATEVPAFHRLTMIFETPLCLGYREHRAIHFAHHRFAATDRDPERYQIVGGSWRAFANALISPEHAFVTWVRAHGINRTLALETGIRLAGFVVVLSINPSAFLVYWAALRLSVGFASFVFHHVLHSLDGKLGTFPLPVASRIIATASLLFGKEPLLILTEHERHHEWPRVRARDLPLLPQPRA
jgi:fatty acid desaturase